MDVAGQKDGAAAAPRTLPGLVQDLALRHPRRAAVEAPDRPTPLTFAQLAGLTIRIAGQLRQLGIGIDDRVALVLDNGPETPVAFLAVTSAAACAPLNPAYTATEFEFYLSDLRAKALIVGRGLRSPSIQVARSLGIQRVFLEPDLGAGAGGFSLTPEGLNAPADLRIDDPPKSLRADPSPNDVALVLHTSGTTSRPKIVPLTHANLCASARNVRQTLALCEADRCLNVMPLFHIHGLVAATLASLSAGGTVICSPGFLAPEFFRWVDETRPTWYTAVPTIHQSILARAAANREIIARRPLRFIRSSSSALPPSVMAELEQTFGVPVVEAYGMTEAAHQMTCNPLPPGTRKAGTVGTAAGPEVAILDVTGKLLPAGETGEIVIRGENVTAGYENNLDANATAFVNGWFRTGDQGTLDADGYLTISGRLKEIINRGGEKIAPREIDEILLAHSAVGQAVAFGVPHAALGEDVAAAVVLRPEVRATEAELREFAASRLAPFKVPARILILDQIPKGPTGKIQRIGLAARLGLVAESAKPRQSRPPRPYVAPRNPLEKTVAELWKEMLKVEPISINDRFLELGGDSILAGRITARVCARYSIELPMPILFANPTVAGIAEMIERKTARRPDDAELEHYLAAIEGLSDEEAERLLARRGRLKLTTPFHSPHSQHSMEVENERIARLSPAKRALLEARLRKSGHRGASGSIGRRNPDERAVCSFGQRRLWFLEQLEQDLAAHNVSHNVRIRGPLQVEFLRQALEAIVHRHDVLRTVIRAEDGEPVPTVLAPARFELPIFDLRHLEGASQKVESERLGAADMSRPFRLDRDPILRASLHILSDEEFLLAITIHHIASDGWSGAILSRELWTLYEAFLRGEPSPLEPLPLQYSDYAVWQRERLQGERLGALLGFWRKQLRDVAVLQLPTDRPRPSRPTYRGQLADFALGPEVLGCLRMLSAEADTTLHMTLLAAFAALLSRYCGQHDVPIGVPSAGRIRPELETLIGYFANTLVIRTDLSGNPTFLELLQRVRQTSLATYQHDELPFERLVEELDPQRSLDRNPLVQILFQLTDFVRPESQVGELACTHHSPRHQASRFDLQLALRPRAGGLRGELLYAEDLFDPPTIDRLIGHYQTLLKGIADDPNARLDELPILTEPERQQLLVELNETRLDVPRGPSGQPLCVHDLFEAQVARTPTAIAVDDGRAQLTYAELNRRADRLASRLRSRGIGPESRVGVVAERTPEMVAALLAVWKAGGAYVPLDPRLPQQRLDFLIEDTGTSLVVATEPLPLSRSDVVSINPNCSDEDDDSHHPENGSEREGAGDRLAYILHTSGSTGTPKGAAVVQSAIVNLLTSVGRITGFGPSDRILGLTTLSFDISVIELMLPLVVGGSIRLVSQDDALDGRSLRTIVEGSQVTFLQATPATWRMLVQTGWRGSPGLKAITGGEALSRELADQLLDRVDTLWNMYGPTETTVYSTAVKIERDTPITIGRPVGNTRAYILDSARNLLPLGIPGELYLGGAGLARGYWNRPELTAERFVPNPFAKDPFERIYRTGDVVRYRPDGNIELLGRADHQVKLRGFRIELGEVEAVLGQHPAVAQAAAAICDDGTQDPRLVGYFVRAANLPEGNGASADSIALRNYLKSKLPDYMVPALFVELAALPLTASGKLDRKSLHVPAVALPDPSPVSSALNDVVERELAAIWKRLLRIPRVDRNDSFFDLGGHSLLAVQMLAQAERLFGSAPPLRTIFERPTLADAPAAIRDKRTRAAVPSTRLRSDPPHAATGDPKPPLIIAPSLFGHSDEWDTIWSARASNRSVFGLEVDGDEPYWSDAPSLEEMAERFCDSVCLSIPEGPFHLAGYSFGAWLAYAMACRFAELGRTPLSVILVDSQFRQGRRSWPDRILRDVPSIVRNVPRWFVNQFDAGALRETTARIRRRLLTSPNGRMAQKQAALAQTNGHKNGEINAAISRASGVFDLEQLPDLYRRRMILSFRAQAAYRPRPFRGRLAYLQCAIRPLVHHNLPDGGWRTLVTGPVETHRIPGSHGSAVTGRFAKEVAAVLDRVMASADPPPNR